MAIVLDNSMDFGEYLTCSPIFYYISKLVVVVVVVVVEVVVAWLAHNIFKIYLT